MVKKLIFRMGILCCLLPAVSPAQTVLPLYSGTPPGAKTTRLAETHELFLGTIPIVRHVTQPTLTVFAAPEPTGAAVVVCPGGAYGFVAYETEGNAVARRFQAMGVTAFVLKYRLPDARLQTNPALAPLQDAQQALRLVRRRAAEWRVQPDKVGIIGFSAGGHLAASTATHFAQPVLPDPAAPPVRPDFLVLVYPVISFTDSLTHTGSRGNLLGGPPTAAQTAYFSVEKNVDARTPPTLLVHCADDATVPVGNSLAFYTACLRAKVPVEMHLYPKGDHGFGLRNPHTPDDWMDRTANWLAAQGLARPAKK